jgi:hypothetical protein
MADTVTPNALGTANAARQVSGADLALFQTVYQSEVLASFEQSTIMLDKHFIRTIQSGKSATFPVMGRTTAHKHTIGARLVGDSSVKANEKVIAIDGLILSDIYISNIEEAMAYYDVRGPYSTEQGRALATLFDKSVAQCGVLGSAATSLLTPQNPAGGAITDANLASGTLATRVGAVVAACFTAAVKFENANIPEGERFLLLAPGTYMDIVQNTTAINKDWGGAGAFSSGTVTEVAGIKILKSPNMGFAQYAGGVVNGDNVSGGDHDVDLTYVYGLFFTPTAIGTVKLMDLAFESAWMIDYQATLMVAKYAMGHSWLRPECLIRLIKQA